MIGREVMSRPAQGEHQQMHFERRRPKTGERGTFHHEESLINSHTEYFGTSE